MSNGMLTVSLTALDKQELVDMLLERLEPFLSHNKANETDDDGLELLDREQVMRILKIKASKMQDIINSGELRICRLNRRILIRKTDLQNFIEKNIIN